MDTSDCSILRTLTDDELTHFMKDYQSENYSEYDRPDSIYNQYESELELICCNMFKPKTITPYELYSILGRKCLI